MRHCERAHIRTGASDLAVPIAWGGVADDRASEAILESRGVLAALSLYGALGRLGSRELVTGATVNVPTVRNSPHPASPGLLSS